MASNGSCRESNRLQLTIIVAREKSRRILPIARPVDKQVPIALAACLLTLALCAAAVARAHGALDDKDEAATNRQITQTDIEWQAIKKQLAVSLNETLTFGSATNRTTTTTTKTTTIGATNKSDASAVQQVVPSLAGPLESGQNDTKPKVTRRRQTNNVNDDDDDNESSSTGQAQQSSAEQQQGEQQQNELDTNQTNSFDSIGQDSPESVTCSPDYEDSGPTLLIDPTINEANLSAEQQAQLLSGARSESLGLGGQHNSKTNNATQSIQQLLEPAQQSCTPSSSRMIEVITKIITPILFSIIIVVGLLGNIIVMLVIIEDRHTERELTPTNLLILDLSLADLSFIIFCIPFTGWDYAVGHWVFGHIWCKFNQYLIVVCALSSIYTLVLMSIDRFMAIVYPIECINYRTSKNMLNAIIIKWVLIFFIASPTIAMHGLIESPLGPEQYTCRFLSDQYNPLHFQIIFFVTSYLSPLVLIFCLYLSLLNKLWFGAKPRGHKESLKMLESKKKVTWLVASIVIVFALCWCPIQIMLILMRLKTHKITATYVAIQVFAHILGYMNSCINPIVYAFASETFNQSFKRSWFGRAFWRCYQACCCCCGCCENCCSPAANIHTTGSFGGPGVTGGAGSRSMSLANANQAATNYHTTNATTTILETPPAHLKTASHSAHHHDEQQAQLEEGLRTCGLIKNNTSGNNHHCQSGALTHINNQKRATQDESRTTLDYLCSASNSSSQAGGTESANRLIDQKFASNSQTNFRTAPRTTGGTPLALEPRDRPILPPQPIGLPRAAAPSDTAATRHNVTSACDTFARAPSAQQSNGSISASSGSNSLASRTPTSSIASYCDYTNMGATDTSTCASTTCQRANSGAAITSNTSSQHQKHQLVALMTQTSAGSQQAVSHKCEPCGTELGEHQDG